MDAASAFARTLPQNFGAVWAGKDIDNHLARVSAKFVADGELLFQIHMRHENSDPWGATGWPGSDGRPPTNDNAYALCDSEGVAADSDARTGERCERFGGS